MNLSSLIDELLFRLWTELMYLIEDELHRFLHPLEDWMTDLVNRPLPADWRQRLHAYLDEQHELGYEIAPEHRPILERHIESWAAFRGMLPGDGFVADLPGPRGRPTGLVVVPDILDPPGGRDGRSDGSPFRLAAVTKVGAGSGVVDLTGWGEKAGEGPVPSAAFCERVQTQLRALDSKVAIWWKSEGDLRSRDAGWFGKGHYGERKKNGRSIVTVHKDFTAVEAAEAIVVESENPDQVSVGQAFRTFWLARRPFDAPEILSDQQRRAVRAAGQQAGQLASIFYESIASLTKAGDLVVLVNDLAENGFSWHQFLYLLPAMAFLPKGVKYIVLRVAIKGTKGFRELRIPITIAERLKTLAPKKLQKILKRAESAKNEKEAIDIIERELKEIEPPPKTRVPPVPKGKWVKDTAGMQERAWVYQGQITGYPGFAYKIENVEFDGIAGGRLLEAKGPGHKFLVQGDQFKYWVEGKERFAKQARDQSRLANGYPLEWHIAEQEFLVALEELFRERSIVGIKLVHTPAK